MTHEDAFLQEILANPQDDTPRLVYADWLIDRGEPSGVARGEFIQVQCALARQAEGETAPRALLTRERQLLAANRREWGSPFQRLGCRCWEYRRGFVTGVGVGAHDFLTQAATLFRLAPVSQVKLYNAAGVIHDLADSPHLARLSTLDLEGNGLGDLDLQVLAGSPHLGTLTTLLLWSNHLGNAGLEALAGAPQLGKLQRLDLSGNTVGNEGARALADAPLMARLRLLDLQNNQIGDPGARALAQSPHAGTLSWLDLAKNPIGLEVQGLLRARFAGRVHMWG